MNGTSRLLEHECTRVALLFNLYLHEDHCNEVKKFSKDIQEKQAYILVP